MSDAATSETDPRDLKISEQAETIAELTKVIEQLKEQNKELKERIKRLEALLATRLDAKSSKKPVFPDNYSLDRNKLNGSKHRGKNSDKKSPKKSTGRRPTEAKEHLVSDTIEIFPEGVDRDQCIHHRFQSAWRIVDGKTVYLRYDIRDLPDTVDLPLPPGVRNSRSEFGTEVILILGYLHYWIGVSQENAISIMNFFTGLDLSKSQADSLLTQLAAHWELQHDTIAELIALQTIVYIDETGWKVGKKGCYTWIFSTAELVLFRCGVSRKKTEATSVLGDFFNGIGVTDDYAAYKNLFSEHQLCWAHLLRKAIKLVLQNPDVTEYADFMDQLCGIYHDAKELRDNVAASVAGNSLNDASERKAVVAKLQARIQLLCGRRGEEIITSKAAAKSEPPIEATPSHVETFILLQRELADNVDCLFVFVEYPEVEATNNRSERNARREAEIRKGARTNKTDRGAKRRSIVVTVLASLRTRITRFTLSNMLAEVGRWVDTGKSLFELELEAIRAKRGPPTQPEPI